MKTVLIKYCTFLILLLSATATNYAQNGSETDTVIAEEAAYGDTEPAAYTEEGDEEDIYVEEPVYGLPTQPTQPEQRAISDQQWNKLSEGPDFKYVPPGYVEERQDIDPARFSWFGQLVNFFIYGAGLYILYVLGAALVLFIVFRLARMKGNPFFSKKDKKMVQQDEYADDYVPEDWDKTIRDAAESGNYRLAIRHAYRYLLVLLSEGGHISFQAAKTNYQYGYELAGSTMYQPFMQLTRQYDYAWYGNFEVDSTQYRAYTDVFNELKGRL